MSPNKARELSVAARVSMAVRMREVLARPWFGVCVPLALSLHCFHGNFRLRNRIYFNLFFN